MKKTTFSLSYEILLLIGTVLICTNCFNRHKKGYDDSSEQAASGSAQVMPRRAIKKESTEPGVVDQADNSKAIDTPEKTTVPKDSNNAVVSNNFGSPTDMPEKRWIYKARLLTPWGYNRSENSSRKYPLVVVLHNGNIFNEEIQKKYPAFYYSAGDTLEKGKELAEKIRKLVEIDGYRIDLNRIYSAGWSQGGSGSFRVARGLYEGGGLFFAGIIRMAGFTDENENNLLDPIVKKTAILYGIGLRDRGPARVAAMFYDFIKKHPLNSGVVETIEKNTESGGFQCNIKTLKLNGKDIMKMMEYPDGGHRRPRDAAEKDPKVFEWLFSQSLGNQQ